MIATGLYIGELPAVFSNSFWSHIYCWRSGTCFHEIYSRVERFLNIFEIKHAIIGKSCVYDILRNPKNILEKYQYLTHAHWHWILNFHTSKTSLLTGMPILATNAESISYYFLLISQAFKWNFIEHFYPSWIFNPRATSPHLR